MCALRGSARMQQFRHALELHWALSYWRLCYRDNKAYRTKVERMSAPRRPFRWFF